MGFINMFEVKVSPEEKLRLGDYKINLAEVFRFSKDKIKLILFPREKPISRERLNPSRQVLLGSMQIKMKLQYYEFLFIIFLYIIGGSKNVTSFIFIEMILTNNSNSENIKGGGGRAILLNSKK